MDAKDILVYLKLVGKELEGMRLHEPIQLLMIGGGYMLTQIKNRDVTGDIDAVWVSPAFHVDSEAYWLFEEAVQAVGDRENLGPSWLNVTGSDFVREAGLPKMKRWKKFGPIHVYLPPKDFILAHKLLRTTPEEFRRRNVFCGGDIYANKWEWAEQYQQYRQQQQCAEVLLEEVSKNN